eukprot:11579309-Ditylum_brightwellii.AAC.1
MNVYEPLWIDFLERRVYIHKAATEKVIDKYIYNMNDKMKEVVVSDYSFGNMSRQFTHEGGTEDKVSIPIWPCINPMCVHKFLVHLVLSLGHFKTEMDLWNAGSIAEVFYNAKLLPKNPLEEGLPIQDE